MTPTKTIFQASLLAAKKIIEKEFKRGELVLLEMFIDYEGGTIQQYYKFKGDNSKYTTEKKSLSDNSEKQFSDLVLKACEKGIPDFARPQYATLKICMVKKEITETEMYYYNKLNIPRVWSSKQNK